MSLDSALFLSINGSATSPHWVTALALFTTERLPQLMAGCLVGICLAGDRQARIRVLHVIAAMAMAWTLARLVQHFIPIDRPFVVGLGKQWLPHAASHSFPSLHASVAFGFAAAVALATGRLYWAFPALALALLVAWSRVYLGLHYPSDVLAGALVGAASAWLTYRLFSQNRAWPSADEGLA
jgi:undecaprenyl-diphosphatase